LHKSLTGKIVENDEAFFLNKMHFRFDLYLPLTPVLCLSAQNVITLFLWLRRLEYNSKGNMLEMFLN